MKKVVTIAGSDATGGGGIEADLKTFQEYGVFGFAAITSIVTMFPESGKHQLTPLDLNLIDKQIDSALAGPIDAIKTGLLPSREIIELTSQKLFDFSGPIVVDPVIAGKGTTDFLNADNVTAMREVLLPMAYITTPNLREAGILSGLGELKEKSQIEKAAKIIYSFGAKNVVIKGGGAGLPFDLYYNGEIFHYFPHPIIETTFNHGAGCTFAASITAALAKDYELFSAIKTSINFVQAAIKAGIAINPYVGHVWHGAYNHAEKRMEENHD
ncbi:bifunctional hydroxymethylpyrimidine kinase/phosphomethylpyrimidine kinase [Enterococcus sp. ALS3]|uniref:pyridoxal kinase n=1 Tax=Enterococcus alishanensis TaxID=1303817 RepID=A0ABS6TDH2_9ENTE|nr:bifunctional hydroxymethylpyrimidine kinase/phosphomethylpyrimidine kinase [Enterococcus alishanensis]MBV7390879.1 bifunctional hydroxymethylpyrimidine kinase/phosphomethylpyrimidine kinase [Enterococcus alishanensis]